MYIRSLVDVATLRQQKNGPERNVSVVTFGKDEHFDSKVDGLVYVTEGTVFRLTIFILWYGQTGGGAGDVCVGVVSFHVDLLAVVVQQMIAQFFLQTYATFDSTVTHSELMPLE